LVSELENRTSETSTDELIYEGLK
jgi:hypothetical protein